MDISTKLTDSEKRYSGKTVWLDQFGHVTLSELKEIQANKLSGKYQYQTCPGNSEFEKAFRDLGEPDAFIETRNDSDNDLESLLDILDDIDDDKIDTAIREAIDAKSLVESEIVKTFFSDSHGEVIESTNNPTNSNFDLIECLHEIHGRASRGIFEDSDYSKFLEINSILDEGGVSPVDRFVGLKMFDRSACRQTDIKSGTAPFMRALQVIDLRFVWRWYRVRKTFGQCAGIFEGELFNLDLAKQIAAIRMKTEGKIGNDALDLSSDIQRKLIVLRDDAARQWQSEQRRKMDQLHNERMALEGNLKDYRERCAKSKQLTDERIRVYGLVFVAMKLANGSHSKAITEYKNLTGETKKRDFIKDRSDRILELSREHGWGIAF